jgi:serine/threonine-protein kinase HipA
VNSAAIPGELVVLLQGRVAGVLRRSASASHLLIYDAAWRDDPEAFPLSLSLPLAGREHKGAAVTYYLRGLLPDSEPRLNSIAHQYGVSADDPFALLANIGEDCPGAVQFARPERVPDLVGDGPQSIEWLSDHDVAKLLRELANENARTGPAVSTGQFSLPGALAKTALTWDESKSRWGRPTGRSATTHILKPPLPSVPFHNEIEHLSLELARHVGCPAAASAILRVEDQSAISVERYDRERQGETVVRIHQEDLSQALGANPRLKYVTEGAHGIAEAVGLLRDHSARSDDVYAFLRAIAFNWVIAGTDAHVRNYSVMIRRRGNVSLAPLYDLASALLLKTRTRTEELPFAMSVAGQRTLGEINRAAWELQATAVRLDPGRMIGEIEDLLTRVIGGVAHVTEAGIDRGVDAAFAARFADRIRSRAMKCAKELGSR